MKLKNLVDSLGVEVQTICVDSADVRDALLNDERYKIKAIPTVLTLYDNSQFMIITGKELDKWMNELIQNVQEFHAVQEAEAQRTILETSPEMQQQFYQPQEEISTTILGTPGAPPLNQKLSQIPETSKVKEIKKNEVSPAEMASQMAKARENHDERLQENRPFI
jgi:hypothetical protein